MQTTNIYDVISKIHADPETCFEFWLLSNAGIIPGKAEARKTATPPEPLTVSAF